MASLTIAYIPYTWKIADKQMGQRRKETPHFVSIMAPFPCVLGPEDYAAHRCEKGCCHGDDGGFWVGIWVAVDKAGVLVVVQSRGDICEISRGKGLSVPESLGSWLSVEAVAMGSISPRLPTGKNSNKEIL